MKKKLLILLILCINLLSFSQETQYYNALDTDGSTSGNSRAPQGLYRYSRTVYLISATELAASGLVNGDVINSIGFNYITAQNIATTGNFVLYMQNTADVTNSKSTTWATAITGMTTVSNATITIPATTGETYHAFTGGSTFTYTGQGIYIAFDYQNPTNPVATTANVALCNTSLAAGLISAQSTTAVPTTIVSSNWRPQTYLGKDVPCSSPLGIDVNAETESSADVSWTGVGTNYSIQYGLDGFTLGTGTIVSNISSPYTIPSLNSGTDYSFYIKKTCGVGNESIWAGPYYFTTVFSAVTPPYLYGFETENVDDWSILNAGTGNNWSIYTQAAPIPLAAEGTIYAGYNYNATNAANAWLFSRRLNLTTGIQYSVKFKYRIADGTVYSENFKVTMGTAKSVVAQSNILATYNACVLQTWTQADLTFTPSTSGDFYLAFNCFSDADKYRLAIDDIQITTVLSTNEFLESKFSVYPNPTTGIIEITNTTDAQVTTVEISDINGRVIKTVSPTETHVNISEFSEGIYMMKIISDKGTVTKKIIKE